MNSLPWETNNIMDPECLLSVMSPERRLDKRKWCVVLCWDNSPCPSADDRCGDMKCTQTTGFSRVHEERETPKAWEMSDSEWQKLLLRDPQLLSVHVYVLHHSLYTYKLKTKKFKPRQFQYIIWIKCSELVPEFKLIVCIYHQEF